MTEPNNRATLYRKIAAVAGAIGTVERDGRNKDKGYTYPTPASVMLAVKPIMAEYQLAIVPHLVETTINDTGQSSKAGTAYTMTYIKMHYHILDGESGESLVVPWEAQAGTWGDDKGIAKAQTIAFRTFLINLFQIPAVDEESDPDSRQSAPIKGASYDQRPPAKPQAPAARPEPTPAEMITGIRELWRREKAIDEHSTPAADLATDLDTAPVAQLKELGRNAKARLAELRKAQEQPA